VGTGTELVQKDILQGHVFPVKMSGTSSMKPMALSMMMLPKVFTLAGVFLKVPCSFSAFQGVCLTMVGTAWAVVLGGIIIRITGVAGITGIAGIAGIAAIAGMIGIFHLVHFISILVHIVLSLSR